MRIKELTESSGVSFRGSFTPDLITSKVWLLAELEKISRNFTTIYVLGSWYGNLALYINLEARIRYEKLINVETNRHMLEVSKMILDTIGAKNIQYMLKNANSLDYRQLDRQSVVINTSINDIEGNEWFDNIPPGTLVALQARNNNENREFDSLDELLAQFPVDSLYQGILDLEDPQTEYQRFLAIGRKL